MYEGQLQQSAALEFITSGNAIFTLVSKNAKIQGTKRFTYRVKKSDKSDTTLFVGVLNGPDNFNDYAPMCYIKIIDGFPNVLRSSKTWISTDAPSYKAFDYVFYNLLVKKYMPDLEIWHEGRCCRCGRLLTVPESVESGIGPECAKKERKISL